MHQISNSIEIFNLESFLILRDKMIALKVLFFYFISSVIRRNIFHPKQSKRSRSLLSNGSRSLGLFRKGKNGIIPKFHRTDLVI